MQIVKKQLSELHKTDVNIRRHSERQIQEYVRSLKMFGQIRPLVVTDDGEILVGNGMFEALKAMGAESCDVYVVSGMTKTQKRKLMLADNKVYEMGFTDISVLDDILKDLGGDFDIPGYDASLLDALVSTPDEITKEITDYGKMEPEVRQTPVSETSVTARTQSQEDAPAYAPPVRTPSGEFKNPEGPYVICPKCGEKIWL